MCSSRYKEALGADEVPITNPSKTDLPYPNKSGNDWLDRCWLLMKLVLLMPIKVAWL